MDEGNLLIPGTHYEYRLLVTGGPNSGTSNVVSVPTVTQDMPPTVTVITQGTVKIGSPVLAKSTEAGDLYLVPSNTVMPTTQEVYPVPTVFTQANGTWSVTLFRKGDSLYTVAKHEQAFQDVTADNYAKDSIETLASKYILNGFEDGTYRPDQAVTCAEFVAMLTRALASCRKRAPALLLQTTKRCHATKTASSAPVK